ncbi:MAG TPA: HAD family phosphatase [Solirubrobacteraceae bacterium]
MPRFMPPAAVLFDNDGLTLDTEPAWTRAETALFARYGQTFTMEHKRELLGTAPAAAAAKLERMLGRPGPGLSDELYELAIEEVAGAEPMPGAVALLAALEAAGVPVALVSNARRRFVERGLRSAGLDDAFAVIVTADDVARPKPAPDPYLAGAAALGAEPRDCAVLEDSPTGVAAGRAAGALTIGVPSLPGIALEADVVGSSLEDPAIWRALGLEARVT